MSNPYFTFANTVARLSRARSSWPNTIGAAIEAAFDLLPTPTALFTETANYAEDEGSANAYAITLSQVDAYIDGLKVRVKIGTANTGACTLNVSGLGARAIKRPDGTNPSAGDFAAGKVHEFSYEATSSTFQVLTVTTADIAAAAASASAAATSAAASATSATASATSATSSAAARDKALEWAEKDEDLEVEAGLYSAKHYAAKASDSALAVLREMIGNPIVITEATTAIVLDIPAEFTAIEFEFWDFRPATSLTALVMQLGTAGAEGSFITASQYGFGRLTGNGATVDGQSTGVDAFPIGLGVNTGSAAYRGNGEVQLRGLNTAGAYVHGRCWSGGVSAAPATSIDVRHLRMTAAANVNAVKFMANVDDIASLRGAVYGLRGV